MEKTDNAKLENKIKAKETEIEKKDFRIRSELEPRLRVEQQSYDAHILTDPSCEGNEAWQFWLDQMIDMVAEHPAWFDWEDNMGELDERILYLIKGHLDGRKLGVEKV